MSTIATILTMRTDWEELVRDLKLPDTRYQGTLENLRWFIRYGRGSNGMTPGYQTALELAKEIVREAHRSPG